MVPASSLWAPGCDSLRLHSRIPSAHARVVLCFLNGSVVFGDLSRVPKDYREGGKEDTFHFQSPRRLERKWERVPVKFGYPLPPTSQRCQSLMGSGGPVFKAELPL
ncbi:unnamed protein product, partial [Staurois parvus]